MLMLQCRFFLFKMLQTLLLTISKQKLTQPDFILIVNNS